MKRMFITNIHGVVHILRDDDTTCPEATRTMRRAYVTPVQCVVYKLPCCIACWRQQSAYDYHIRYSHFFNRRNT